MSMLELVIASSMLAIVLASVAVVMRTGRLAWESHVADYTRIESAHATLRHIVRQVRQAESVVSMTPSTDNSGQLSLQMPDNSTLVWDHNSSTSTVDFGVTAASTLLASDIAGLRFTGFEADGTTVTTNVAEIQAIFIDVTVQLPVQVGATRVISSWAWIRSW
jgi:hypothetical protein